MAHMIDVVSKGRASYASTQREWHGLGALMTPKASVEEWQACAGMDYEVKRAFVRYAVSRNGAVNESDLRKMDDRVVLFRTDTGDALGVVSDSYKVVQPREVLEFFREWAAMGGLTIESAGVLCGGKRYFATAKLAEGVLLDGYSDKVVPYALLSTSADGSLATECRWTTVRTVCNNTLTMACKGRAAHRTTHRSAFVASAARDAVEAAHAEFGAFMATARSLAEHQLRVQEAATLTELLLGGESREEREKARKSAGFAQIMRLFQGEAQGALLESAAGTEWGWLNSVTEYVDHHAKARNDENRAVSALWGAGERLKGRAMELLANV